jgi:hypothetical protein
MEDNSQAKNDRKDAGIPTCKREQILALPFTWKAR